MTVSRDHANELYSTIATSLAVLTFTMDETFYNKKKAEKITSDHSRTPFNFCNLIVYFKWEFIFFLIPLPKQASETHSERGGHGPIWSVIGVSFHKIVSFLCSLVKTSWSSEWSHGRPKVDWMNCGINAKGDSIPFHSRKPVVEIQKEAFGEDYNMQWNTNEKRSAWTCWVSGVKFNHGSTSSRWRSYDHDDRTTHDREDLRDRSRSSWNMKHFRQTACGC